jgi:catechol 2,3-dioxygenase-like lactoylglutathione lyase family enzyme
MGGVILMRIKRIHHVTMAVRDLEGARLTFEQLFDVQAGRTADVPAFGIRALDVAIGDDVLQLASPVDADNPVMRFLERKGEGFYNLALEIDDLDETVRELASQGVRVSEPIELEPGVRSAFVTMAATHGLSVQLVEVVQSVGLSVDQPVSESAGQGETEPVARHTVEDEPLPEEAAPSPRQQLLDLTPDEWSDVD